MSIIGLFIEREHRDEVMLNQSIGRLVLRMAVPTIISMLINSVYNLADTYFVSMLGTEATGAVGVNSSLDYMIMMTGSFLGFGANSYIARLLGAKQKKKADEALSTAFFTAFIIGCIAMVLGLTFVKPLVRLLGSTEGTEQYAIDYAQYVLLAAPFVAANYVMNPCLRSEGSSMYSMIGITSGCILNIALDPIFIFTFDLGVKGASMATALSKVVSFCILIAPYIRKKSMLRLSIRNVRYSFKLMSEIIRIGASTFFRGTMNILASILINHLAGGYSDSALAALSVVNRLMLFLVSSILGFSQGFQPIAGYNWGAKRFDRVKASYRFSSKVIFIAGCVIGLLMAVFSKPIIGLFTDGDAELIRLGQIGLVSQCIALPFHGWCAVVSMLLSGIGWAKGALAMSLSRQGIFFIPALLILPVLFGVEGLACAQAAADILTLCLAIPLSIRFEKNLKAYMEGTAVATL